ncbi:11381_t:CDS:2 [Funneliformis caledonium]|uniref:11381_t:CDS:1 n=1 Tax=Funneliformis caledonium TaxID=1117310 RepID=A0A9N8W075_9GLOM|nr:11381_t:CDS:2 [Funneliformis caledonium]
MNSTTNLEEQYYDDLYFDSDTADEETENSTKELFYDEKLDDDYELWMEKKLSQHGSDAILSCPLCFTPLSYHTQKHELYSNQYRAIFVENCKIIKTEKLLYDESKRKNKRRQNEDESSNGSNAKQESYYPVECKTCGTKVAVMDEDEVFHFFNAIPS